MTGGRVRDNDFTGNTDGATRFDTAPVEVRWRDNDE
jgi:hypothetical protein